MQKKLYFAVQIIITILLLLIAGMLFFPAYKAATQKIYAAKELSVQLIQEKTGLLVSCSSISPSLLKRACFRDIEIFDSYSGTKICSLKKIYVYYDPLKFLGDAPWKAITRIDIENGNIAVDMAAHDTLIRKLRSLGISATDADTAAATAAPDIPEIAADATSAAAAGAEMNTADLFGITDSLEISIKNVRLDWSDGDTSLTALLQRTAVSVADAGISVDVVTGISFSSGSFPLLFPCSSTVHFNGLIDHRLSAGSARIVFEDNMFPNFSAADIAFLATLSGTSLNFRSIQSVTPLDVQFGIDFSSGTVSATLASEDFKPFEFIRAAQGFESKFADATVTGRTAAEFNSFRDFSFECNTVFTVPGLYRAGESAAVTLAVQGTQDEITCDRLAVDSPSAAAEFAGFFLYDPPESGTLRSKSVFPFIPDGKLAVTKLVLPDGSLGTATFFLNAYRQGFMLFSPAVAFGPAVYSNAEFIVEPSQDAVDITFSCVNYAADDGLDGAISAEATLTFGDTPYGQLFVAVDTLMLDPVLQTVSALSSGSSGGTSALSGFAVTTELYASTDFSHLSFNCPRFVFAGIDGSDLYAILSVSGSERNLDFTDVTVVSGKNTVQGDIHAEIETDNSILFSTGFTFNSIPYEFNGMYTADGEFNMYGDYGFSLAGSVDDTFSHINGRLFFSALPVSVAGFTLSASIDSSFEYAGGKNVSWRFGVDSFDVAELSGKIPSMPQFHATGTFDNTGIFFEKLLYSDVISELDGTCSVNWNFDGVNRFVETMLVLESATSESIQVNGVISNSSAQPFFSPEEMFFSMQAAITDLSAGHFFANQQAENTVSCTASLSGNATNIYINFDCPRFSFVNGDMPVGGQFNITAAENTVQLQNASFSAGAHSFSAVELNYELQNAAITLHSLYSGILIGNGITSAIDVHLSGISDPTASVFQNIADLVQNFSADIVLSDTAINGNAAGEPVPLLLIKLPDQLLFSAGEDTWFQGVINMNGLVAIDAKAPFPAEFSLTGNLNPADFSLSFQNASFDFPRIWDFLNIVEVDFVGGILSGDFNIQGSIQDPEFIGTLAGTGVALRIPDFIEGQTEPFPVDVTANANTITIKADEIAYGAGILDCTVDVIFDRWNLGDVVINTRTLHNTRVAADMQIFMAHIKGAAAADLSMRVNENRFFLGGAIELDNGFVCLSNDFSSLSAGSDNSGFFFSSDFSVVIGNHVEFLFPSERMPILRAVLVAADPLRVFIDGEQQLFTVNGAADMKGGQIFYVKRNFYLRNGMIEINANQNIFDPIISFQAEIRERDTENQAIRIILSANRQYLSRLSPVLSASPPKSEAEIRTLLGHAAFTDAVTGSNSENVSVKELAISVSDVFTQFFLFRQFEDFMRESLHLDSFSIRSQLLQNVINSATSNETAMRIGNYFDNTSVYVGKYLGSDLYLDGMFHLYYDKTTVPNDQWGGLRAQFDIGFEMASPFANIRYNFSPKVENLKETLGVPDTSVTLSWKFNF